MESRQRKFIAIIVGSFIVFAAVVTVISILLAPKEIKTGIQFITVPDAITVKGGALPLVVNYDTVAEFQPGEYELEFSATHFAPYTEKVTVKEGEISPVYVLLEAVDDTGNAILKEDKYGIRIERISGYRVSSGGASLGKEYPFINKLPIIGKYFYAYPCVVDEESKEYGVCIKLALEGDIYKEQALTALREKDIDPSTITILYK